MKRARSDSQGGDEPELQKRTKGESSEPNSPLEPDVSTVDKPAQPLTKSSGSEATSSPVKPESELDQDKSSSSITMPQKGDTSSATTEPSATNDANDAIEKTTQDQAENKPTTTEASQDISKTGSKRETVSEDGHVQDQNTAEPTDKNLAELTGTENTKDAAKDSIPAAKETPSKPTTFASFTGTSGFSAFSGSGPKFQSMAKSPGVNPWAEPSKATETKDEKKAEDEKTKFKTTSPEESAAGFEKQQDLVTGEEEEETEYSVKVRLYAVNLDSEQKNWKERGVGTLKLNSSCKDKSKKRLLMRAESVLRVSLNLPLVKNTQISKGFHSSLHTEKFLRISSIEDGHACQFAMKLVSEDARDKLYEEIERALAAI